MKTEEEINNEAATVTFEWRQNNRRISYPPTVFHAGFVKGYSAASSIQEAALREVIEARDKLQAFKDFVHRRLDEAGIPTHPDGEHSKAGCRIGDRLDIALRFTGFKDKNGLEICDGDILAHDTDATIVASWNKEWGCWDALENEHREHSFGLLAQALKDGMNSYAYIGSIINKYTSND